MSTTPICWSAVATVVVLAVSLPKGPRPADPPLSGDAGAAAAGLPTPTTVVPPAELTPMTTAVATPTAPSAPATARPVRRRGGGPVGAAGSGSTANGARFSVTTPLDAVRRSESCEIAANCLGVPAHDDVVAGQAHHRAAAKLVVLVDPRQQPDADRAQQTDRVEVRLAAAYAPVQAGGRGAAGVPGQQRADR